MQRVILLIACLTAPLFAQGPSDAPLDLKTVKYTTTIQGQEIGQETLTIGDGSWISDGKVDLFGTQKASWRITMKRLEDGSEEFSLLDPSKKDSKPMTVLVKGMEIVLNSGTDKATTKTIDHKFRHFAFQNLAWGPLVDLGRKLVDEHRAGTLPEEAKCSGLILTVGRALKTKIVATKVMPQNFGGQTVLFRSFTLKLGAAELALLCEPGGTVVRVDVSSQKLVVTAEGFEDIIGAAGIAESVVGHGPWREKLSKASFETEKEEGVEIAMRDGTKLIADIYRPKGEGPFPAILTRTPYNRSGIGIVSGPWWAKRGYVFVAQDVRGRFDSGGTWYPLINEERDGSDTVTWIAKQSWSSGKVGMIGASYGGWVQWLCARSGNPGLVAIVPQVSPPDPHENIPYEGGAFILGSAWWAKALKSISKGEGISGNIKFEELTRTRPLGKLSDVLKADAPWLKDWVSHLPHDREYWGPVSYQDKYPGMNVAALNISGWFDGDQPGAPMNFSGMRAFGPEKLRDHQYLVMGPWTHAFNTTRKLGKVDFGDTAIVDLDARTLLFFDHYLKGMKNGIEDQPKVFAFIMGLNEWVTGNEWPLTGAKSTRLFLGSTGGTQRRNGGGRMTPSHESAGQASDTYTYDPENVPPLPEGMDEMSDDDALSDQSKLADRDDNIEFLSPPLARDCFLLGQIEVELWVSSDATDTDFAFKLHVQDADGKLKPLSGGIQRLRYHKGPTIDSPLTPGEITKLTIDGWAKGIKLENGERLQLEISSSMPTSSFVHTNTLENHATATKSVKAKNTVHYGKVYPSALVLPVFSHKGAAVLSFKAQESK